MSELIRCKTCGWEVSTAASNCPHCGEPNFKPVAYLAEEERKIQQAEVQKRHMALAKADREYGYNLEVYAEGEYPNDWYKSIRFFGTRIRGNFATLSYDYDKQWYGRNEPTHVRLLPGTYKARYTELTVAGRTINEVQSEAVFTISDNSRQIVLHFSKKLLSKRFKLTSVTAS